MRPLLRIFALLALLLPAVPAGAVQPDEILSDPLLEARARDISRDLRCLVCQNQSIDDSNAELARDLRVIVRERLVGGDSDRQVLDYVVARYGDFVLLDPPFKGTTLVLWFGPALIGACGLFVLIAYFRRLRRAALESPVALSLEEQRRIAALLAEDGPARGPSEKRS